MSNDEFFPKYEYMSPFQLGATALTAKKGITKREHFAAMAMQGILTMAANLEVKHVARTAVLQAEALIEELEKDEPKAT